MVDMAKLILPVPDPLKWPMSVYPLENHLLSARRCLAKNRM